MVTKRARLALLFCATCATSCAGPSFDAVHAKTIVAGESREQVRAVMGGPDHMTKTLDHPKSCVEEWTYGEPTGPALLVDFDDQGRVCDVAFTQAR